jgi:outer membrane protein
MSHNVFPAPGFLRGIGLFAAVSLLSCPVRSGDARSPLQLTLDGALALAFDQNRDILIAGEDRNKADEQVSEARAGVFPRITVAGQYSRFILKPVLFIPPNTPLLNPTNSTQKFDIGSNNSYLMGINFSQTLFDRKVGVALDIADTYHKYSEQAYEATQQDIALTVKKAFYGVLLAQKLVEANRQGLEVVKANFENVQTLYRHGNAAEYDLLRANVQLANTEPLVTSAENGLLLAKNALKSLLAIPLSREIELKGEMSFEPVPEESMAQADQKALATNPMIAQLALQESMLEMNISVEQSSYFPTLSLVGGYQWQTQDNTFQFHNYLWARTFNVGLQLSYTLFDGLKSTSRVQEASIERQKVHYARLKAEEGLKIQIQSAELKMLEATKRIGGQEKNIDQAEQAVRISQTRFRSGVGTQLELLDSQVAMTRAQTNYAQALYDYLVAKAEWQHAVGMADEADAGPRERRNSDDN